MAATVEFHSRAASPTAPKSPLRRAAPFVVAPKSAPKTPEVAIAGCVSKTTIRVQGPESVSIPGVLYCPERAGVAPGVVLLPATGGVRKHILDWAEWLASEGYVALVLDSDAARRTVTPFRTRMQDAFAAATQLRTLGFVDADRIAMLGFSIGGSAALEAAGERAAAGGAGYRFRAAIAFYPPCASLRAETMIPLLLLLGNKDDVTPPTGCVTAAQRLKDAGKDISWALYPDAHHGFDIVEAGEGMGTPWGHIQYDAGATADARHRVATFLARQLRDSP